VDVSATIFESDSFRLASGKSRKRNAEKRCSTTAAPHGAARALRRARLSAFHHGTCGRDRTPPLSSSHATSWVLVRSARPDGSKDGAHRNARRETDSRSPCVTRGRYPRLTVPVHRDCTRSPVMMPSGRVLPKPPESQGDEPSPAGTALAPSAGVTRPASWYVSEIRGFVLHSVTICQETVSVSETDKNYGWHDAAVVASPRLNACHVITCSGSECTSNRAVSIWRAGRGASG
jgi:hypothetical protein